MHSGTSLHLGRLIHGVGRCAAEMVRSHEKNGTQQNCTTLVEMEATHHPTQRQTEEALDGEHQGGRRMQRIHTERDRTISSVPGQKRVEKLRH